MSINKSREILLNDLDPDFVEGVSVELGWSYVELFERLRTEEGLCDGSRNEEFNRQRSNCATAALARAAKRFGVPYEYRRLSCNGQHKLLVKAGRVIIIQEPIIAVCDRPSPAEYKIELADVHSFVRQLELDLGDREFRIRDWSGCVLATLLHGPTGPRFTQAHKAIGSAMLGVPDASYEHWTVRLDLHSLAVFGRSGGAVEVPGEAETDVQTDKVIVTPKRKRVLRDSS